MWQLTTVSLVPGDLRHRYAGMQNTRTHNKNKTLKFIYNLSDWIHFLLHIWSVDERNRTVDCGGHLTFLPVPQDSMDLCIWRQRTHCRSRFFPTMCTLDIGLRYRELAITCLVSCQLFLTKIIPITFCLWTFSFSYFCISYFHFYSTADWIAEWLPWW